MSFPGLAMDWSRFTPHGFCLAWDPGLIWLQAASDLLIALAYFSIPAALIVFLRRRGDLAFKPVFGLFAAFILACGATHVMGALTLWVPAYWVDGSIKAVTAVLSVATAAMLWPLLPRALALPSPATLRDANAALAQEIRTRDEVAAQLRLSEAHLRQSQKMEAVGQITGGIAHDFNNMLTVVMGCLEMLQRNKEMDARSVRLTGAALQGAQNAANLTTQLLSFSRRQHLDPVALAPSAVVEGIQDLLARTLGESVSLTVEKPAPDQWRLNVDRNQLESALLNVVINARDAIMGHARSTPEDGIASGHVTIRFANRHVSRTESNLSEAASLKPGDYGVISIQDDGPGMSAATRQQAFEPFFTTKPPGVGTGLGLAQTWGFAAQSGGTVQIDSEEGQGTRIDIWLPRYGEAAAAAEEVLPAAARG